MSFVHGATYQPNELKWVDVSGANNHAYVTKGLPRYASESRGGSQLTYVYGSETDSLMWNLTFATWTNYTLFHISRWARA